MHTYIKPLSIFWVTDKRIQEWICTLNYNKNNSCCKHNIDVNLLKLTGEHTPIRSNRRGRRKHMGAKTRGFPCGKHPFHWAIQSTSNRARRVNFLFCFRPTSFVHNNSEQKKAQNSVWIIPRVSVLEKVIVKVLSLGLTKRFVVFLFLWLNCVFRTGQDKKNVWRTELDLILVVVIYRKCALQVWKSCGTGRGVKLHVFYIKWKKQKQKKKVPAWHESVFKKPKKPTRQKYNIVDTSQRCV